MISAFKQLRRGDHIGRYIAKVADHRLQRNTEQMTLSGSLPLEQCMDRRPVLSLKLHNWVPNNLSCRLDQLCVVTCFGINSLTMVSEATFVLAHTNSSFAADGQRVITAHEALERGMVSFVGDTLELDQQLQRVLQRVG